MSGASNLAGAVVHGPPRPGGSTPIDRAAVADQLEFEPSAAKRNHGVFRYPAKFHPPVAGKLVEKFSLLGQTVLDPFCGSGTLLVEAAARGRHAIGTDVDPLAVLVSRAKTAARDVPSMQAEVDRLCEWLDLRREEDERRWGGFSVDVSASDLATARADLAPWIPELPRIDHWFRHRVVVQLAAIRKRVAEVSDDGARQLLELCFASIIRNASNADPVPVSGLEVTSHMLAKEAKGRLVNPWKLMSRSVLKAVPATAEFAAQRGAGCTVAVDQVDARSLDAERIGRVDAVITSPPYLTAVDYYRRHTLEMYWLGLIDRRDERLELLPRYLGRDKVGARSMPVGDAAAAGVATRWLTRFPDIRPDHERSFRHYCDGMARALAGMASVVGDGPIVIVAGDVRFRGVSVSMLELMRDLAGDGLFIADNLWYPIVNRYMSYARRNEASIAVDHVLVFRKR